MIKLTGSRVELAEHCLYWARPEVEWADIGPKKPRAVGLAFHAWVQAGSDQKPMTVEKAAAQFGLTPSETKTLRSLVETWSARFKPLIGWRAEVAFAYDPKTDVVRELGQGIERAYEEAGCKPGEIPLSADLVTMDWDTVVVWDWKTGFQRHLKAAAENRQIRFLAMAAARVYGCTRARVVIAHVGEDFVYTDDDDLGEDDLRDVVNEVRTIAARLDWAPEPEPGPHCSEMWCPAAASCSATTTAVQELAPAEQDEKRHLPVVAAKSAIRSPEHAAYIWHRLKAIDTMRDAAWSALRSYVGDQGGTSLGDGRVYRRVDGERETVVVDERSRAILQHHFGDRAPGVFEISATKKAIGEAARAVAGRGKPGVALERRVFEALREAGAVRVSTVTSFEAVDDKETEAA